MSIELTGLSTGPAQVWGAVRLVPLLRDEPITDLRLHPKVYGPDELSVVAVNPREVYIAFIPHAFVASWTGDGTPAATYGTQLMDGAKPVRPAGCVGLKFRRRMAKREDRQRLRFMPLHLALEGYLALHFGGPSIAWQEWTRRALTQGLSPRAEAAYVGAAIADLDDALRIFEIYPNQCGVLLYVADALAAALVVPHPDDYRALHPTLIHDLYGDLIYQYALMFPPVQQFRASLDGARVHTIDDLRAEIDRDARAWATFHGGMARGLLEAGQLTNTPVYRMGPFTLSRFLPVFDPDTENHIGETITDDAGRLAYLKTFRLSAAQARKGYLLSKLAEHDWHLDATAEALRTNRGDLVRRLDKAGFGNLLRPDVIDHYRRLGRQATRGRGRS